MTLFDGSWLDGRVRILEPAAADAVATVPVALPGASPGAPAAASLCSLQHAELLIASFEGASIVIAADATDGALKAELGGTMGRVSNRASHHARARSPSALIPLLPLQATSAARPS